MRQLLLGLTLLAPAVGCMSFRPVGPVFGDDAPPESRPTMRQSNTNPHAMIAIDGVPPPVLADAPPPPAPVNLVAPGDVDAANLSDAVRKLADEIHQDRRATDQFPNYSHLSRIERK